MTETVFQKILAESWSDLGSVIRRHYFLRPYSDDYICVRGEMSEIYHSSIAKILLPFGLLFGAVVPYRANNVPVDVHYTSSKTNANIYWDRVFKFSEKNHFHFKSYMEHVQGNEVIEFVRFGVGMRLKVTAENGAIVFRDNGYIWRIFGVKIPIPVNLFFGNAYVEERPLDENNFSMKMTLIHPIFGVMFRYEGKFRLGGDLHTKRMQLDAAESRR
jgi:hypothetical protein